MSKQAEIRDRITLSIVEALKKGCPPWRRPWSAHRSGQPNGPCNAATRRRYKGINVMLLTLAAQRFGFTSNWWATFNQWRGMGARIKARPAEVEPGAWGCKIAFYLPVNRKDKAVDDAQDQAEEEDEKPRFYMREFCVFNGDQVDLEEFHGTAHGETAPLFVDYAPAEEAITKTEARIRFGGERAFYSPSGDYIQLPYRQTFVSTNEFYATAAHELVHWTGHPSRLNRKTFASFGSELYAFEELVAEMGGCFACTELGVPQSEDMSNHNAYLSHWLNVLENDHTAILRASALASKATDFIMAFSKEEAVATV